MQKGAVGWSKYCNSTWIAKGLGVLEEQRQQILYMLHPKGTTDAHSNK